jgi:hypothetical protein
LPSAGRMGRVTGLFSEMPDAGPAWAGPVRR